MRITLRRLVLFLVVAFGIGILIGHLACNDDANSDEIGERDATIAKLHSDIDDLLVNYDAVSQDFEELQTTYENLLQNATAARVSELSGQVSSLTTENANLKSQLSIIQTEHDLLRQSYDAISSVNSDLTQRLAIAENTVTQLNLRIDELNQNIEQLTTVAPNNALRPAEVYGSYKSVLWARRGRFDLQQTAREIGQAYYASHEIVPGVFDCNDMASDIWNMLYKEDIVSVIVIGSLETIDRDPLEESDHAWLLIFDADGNIFYMEPTTGQLLFGDNDDFNEAYRNGWLYKDPADLREDLNYLW